MPLARPTVLCLPSEPPVGTSRPHPSACGAAIAVHVYTNPEFLSDLPEGVFSEPSQPAVLVDPWQLNLQRAYREVVNERLNERSSPQIVMGATSFSTLQLNPHDDTRVLLRSELRGVAAQSR